jgi:hypothetical protein
LPYQSTANGIAGILGNQMNQVDAMGGGEVGDNHDGQAENDMSQSVVVVEEVPTTRTDVT